MNKQQYLIRHGIPELPKLHPELIRITKLRRTFTLSLPFFCIASYFFFATLRWWPLAVFSLMVLSFVTYGSISFVAPFGPLRYDGTTIRKGEFTFSVDYDPGKPPPPRSRLPTADDFLEFQLGDIQIVDVKFNDRKCRVN
jgi:hypothetical protein